MLCGAADEALLRPLLGHDHESVRAWAIRLMTDRMPLDSIAGRRIGPDVEPSPGLLAEFARMAREDRSGLVRLTLASTLQRLPVARRAGLAAPLLARGEDAGDHNLPLLIWYGLIPVADADPAAPGPPRRRLRPADDAPTDRPPPGRGDRIEPEAAG